MKYFLTSGSRGDRAWSASKLLLDVLQPEDPAGVQGRLQLRGLRGGGHQKLHRVQYLLPVGAPLPHLHGLPLLSSKNVLAQYGRGNHEVSVQRDYHKVITLHITCLSYKVFPLSHKPRQ